MALCVSYAVPADQRRWHDVLMLCPYCSVTFDAGREHGRVEIDTRDNLLATLDFWHCPGCCNLILNYSRFSIDANRPARALSVAETRVYPPGSGRSLAPAEATRFDPVLAADYNEACLVLAVSPQAAAALGRRCLQHILRFHVGVTPSTLMKEIEAAAKDGVLPARIARQMEAVRHVGNSAAHPVENAAGEILPVTPGEAEWTLDTIEAMFHYLFVEPVAEYERTLAFNAKHDGTGRQLELPDLPKTRGVMAEDS